VAYLLEGLHTLANLLSVFDLSQDRDDMETRPDMEPIFDALPMSTLYRTRLYRLVSHLSVTFPQYTDSIRAHILDPRTLKSTHTSIRPIEIDDPSPARRKKEEHTKPPERWNPTGIAMLMMHTPLDGFEGDLVELGLQRGIQTILQRAINGQDLIQLLFSYNPYESKTSPLCRPTVLGGLGFHPTLVSILIKALDEITSDENFVHYHATAPVVLQQKLTRVQLKILQWRAGTSVIIYQHAWLEMKVATLMKTLDSRTDIDTQSNAWILSHKQEPLLEGDTLQHYGIQEGSILSIHHQKDRLERNNERYWRGDAAEIRMEDGSLGLGLLVGYDGREHAQVMWIDFTQNTLSDFDTVRAILRSQGIQSHAKEIFLTDRITT